MLSNNPLGGDNPRKTKQELLGLDPKQDKIPAPKIDEMPQEIEKSQIEQSLSELENSVTDKFTKKAKSDQELEELSYNSKDANGTSPKRDSQAPKEPTVLTARSNKPILAKYPGSTSPLDTSINERCKRASVHSESIEPEIKSVIHSLRSILQGEGEKCSKDARKPKRKTLNFGKIKDMTLD